MKIKMTKNMSDDMRNAYQTYNTMYDIDRRDIKLIQMYEDLGKEKAEEGLSLLENFAEKLREALLGASDEKEISVIMNKAVVNYDYDNPVLNYIMDEDEKDSRESALDSIKNIAKLVYKGKTDEGIKTMKKLKKKLFSEDSCFPYDEAWVDEQMNAALGVTK